MSKSSEESWSDCRSRRSDSGDDFEDGDEQSSLDSNDEFFSEDESPYIENANIGAMESDSSSSLVSREGAYLSDTIRPTSASMQPQTLSARERSGGYISPDDVCSLPDETFDDARKRPQSANPIDPQMPLDPPKNPSQSSWFSSRCPSRSTLAYLATGLAVAGLSIYAASQYTDIGSYFNFPNSGVSEAMTNSTAVPDISSGAESASATGSAIWGWGSSVADTLGSGLSRGWSMTQSGYSAVAPVCSSIAGGVWRGTKAIGRGVVLLGPGQDDFDGPFGFSPHSRRGNTSGGCCCWRG